MILVRRSAVLLALLVVGCGDAPIDSVAPIESSIEGIVDEANEREIFHQVQIDLTTPLESGELNLYVFLDGQVSHIETRNFEYEEPQIHIGYNAPLSSTFSVVLMHVTAPPSGVNHAQEYVCFVHVSHETSRHNGIVDCGYSSTVAYYLSATRVGHSNAPPFHDIAARYPVWRGLATNADNDVTGFYVSVFGTLQNALLDMGGNLFQLRRHSIRPVMETIVARFFDQYQREGTISALDLIGIANQVTDSTLPLERLLRFQSVYGRYAYVADVQLTSTGGSLTQRGASIEVLTMNNELSRFFLRESAYEMSDFRTHIVQDINHNRIEDGIELTWDPIAHMYGYNVYLDGEHVGFRRDSMILLPAESTGTVTIKAVGYAGEFDGVHHELAGPTLLAGVQNDGAE